MPQQFYYGREVFRLIDVKKVQAPLIGREPSGYNLLLPDFARPLSAFALGKKKRL